MIFVSITVRDNTATFQFKRLEIHYSFLASLTFGKVAGKEISALFIFVTQKPLESRIRKKLQLGHQYRKKGLMDHNRNTLNESIYIIKYWQVIFFFESDYTQFSRGYTKGSKGAFQSSSKWAIKAKRQQQQYNVWSLLFFFLFCVLIRDRNLFGIQQGCCWPKNWEKSD